MALRVMPEPAAYRLPPHRWPQTVLDQHRRRLGRQAPVWIFGYASLIWRPELEAEERLPARVCGWHRCLRMHSRVNRGTPQEPGLVFALMRGGSCRGFVDRLPQDKLDEQFERLWAREMPIGVYDPRWVKALTEQGVVHALAFTLCSSSPAWTGPMDDARLVHILRHARGLYGSTLDYLLQTHEALLAHGIRDRDVQRMVRVARRHGLCGP